MYLTTDDQLTELVRTDRLAAVLVRYRGTTEGRFTAPAQDVPDLLAMLAATGVTTYCLRQCRCDRCGDVKDLAMVQLKVWTWPDEAA